jgi:hypothetical protein
MKSPTNPQNGVVAILDALGAATYSDPEIVSFLNSREIVLLSLDERIAGVSKKIDPDQIEIFTFNDTIVIILKTGKTPASIDEIIVFVGLLRRFLVDSLKNNILFRGSFAAGTFYIDAGKQTVMGQAISDAAAWYDKSEWIGIHATPRTAMLMQRWFEKNSNSRRHLLLDYSIPLRAGGSVQSKAVNWPKILIDPKLTPPVHDEKPREMLMEHLSRHPVPFGTERKYQNTIEFFDHAQKEIERKNEEKAKKQSARRN